LQVGFGLAQHVEHTSLDVEDEQGGGAHGGYERSCSVQY
jgi:hypothetical protein